MKSKLSIVILSLFCLFACDLDRNPLDKLADSNIWDSEETAKVALVGLYNVDNSNPPTPTDWWSTSGLVFLEFATDNAYDRRGVNTDYHRLTDGTLLATNSYVKSYWKASYKRISLCNDFLSGIDNLQAGMDVVERFKAEARFIRATQYFYLSQFFYDVPLVTTPLTLEEANKVVKTPKEQIISFVIQELKEAAEVLPRYKDLKSAEIGRASKQAALAFLGRAYLSEKQFKEAAVVYKEVIDYGDNIIDKDYESLFIPANQNSSENIFSIQYLVDKEKNDLVQRCYPAKDGGWCIMNPLGSLFEAYQFTDGTDFSFESSLYDSEDLAKNRDPRLKATMLYNGSMFRNSAYISHPDSSDSPDKIEGGQTTQTGFLLRKYLDESYSGDLRNYGGNTPIIRYAEILLSYLEAKLEGGEAITRQLLDETINKVRGRESVRMPAVTETNPDKLRDILRNERRVELALEGIRLWDLMRWRIAHEVLNGDVYGAPFPGSKRNKPAPNGEVDKYGRWYITQRAFREETDYRWPIPQSEQDINPNLR